MAVLSYMAEAGGQIHVLTVEIHDKEKQTPRPLVGK